jgi:phosphotransferase system HPr (HPr) family protein
MKRESATLGDRAGLHARPADLLVRAARGFRSSVRLRSAGAVADGKDIVQVLLLGAPPGGVVLVEAEGPDEGACAIALAALLSRAPEKERMATREVQGKAWVAPPEAERDRTDFETALARTRAELQALESALSRDAGAELAAILGAQQAILADGLAAEIRGRPEMARDPERAVRDACAALAGRLQAASSAQVRGKAADVSDLAVRILRHLAGRSDPLPQGPGPWIHVAPRLEAALVAQAKARGVVGFATTGLDPTAHAWILARGMGMPVAVLAPEALAAIAPGASLRVADETAALPAEGVPGERRLPLRANVCSVEEAIDAFALGADGIGVARSELLFAAAALAPSAQAQIDLYGALLLPFGEHPVTVRLFDAGGDKHVPFLPGPPELRGIARLAAQPKVLADQVHAIEALSRAAPVRLLVPYVESPADLRGLPRTLPVGAMIETEAAVEAADAIAREADFLSIGTNDLCASVLALPRAETRVDDVLRPEMRRPLERVVAAGLPEAIALFLEMGVGALSVSPRRFARAARCLEVK